MRVEASRLVVTNKSAMEFQRRSSNVVDTFESIWAGLYHPRRWRNFNNDHDGTHLRASRSLLDRSGRDRIPVDIQILVKRRKWIVFVAYF